VAVSSLMRIDVGWIGPVSIVRRLEGNPSMPKPADVRTRDVFICFSKSRPGEAKVAIALKDVLERHGLYAFEYEDWSWVGRAVADEVDVDRATLRAMLTTCSVVVLISPHAGEASAGVRTEIEELRACGSPVILLHWSPEGWHPLLEPERFEGLNIVWAHEGSSTREGDVRDNHCQFLAQQLGTGAWLACQVRRFDAEHPTTAGALLARIPEQSTYPLLNFRLRGVAADAADWNGEADLPALAADVAGRGTCEALQQFVRAWRRGTDLMAATLADEAKFSLIRPLRTFAAAGESLCEAAQTRFGPCAPSGRELNDRGLMLVRLNRGDEAIPILTQALETVPHDERYDVFQALALARQEADLQAAVASATSAIECAPDLELACGLTSNRGVMRINAGDYAGAVADFSFAIEKTTNPALRQSALRSRARAHTHLDDYAAAIADYTHVLAAADLSPRMAVSAWMDRGALHHLQKRDAEAIADLTRAIDAADAEPLQRFRALEVRARLLESSGHVLAAAADYEAMAEYTHVAREDRDELRRHAARLRGC
jgi:tetratricopeptide (TPR) repeat protein